MRKPFHYFQPQVPQGQLVVAVSAFGGSFLSVAIIAGAAVLLNTVVDQATLLRVGIGCLVIAVVQAVISGVFVSQWKSPPEETVSFYLPLAFGLLLMIWIGLGSALLGLDPLTPPQFILVKPLIIYGIGIVLILPYIVVQFRRRRRDARRRSGGPTNEG